MLFDDTARSSSCPLLLSFLFNVNIIPATLSSSELAVVVPELGLGRRAGGGRQVPLHNTESSDVPRELYSWKTVE